ncbi:MAG: NIPSNAP family protein, partial [Pseudolabrys sp.]
FLPPMQPGTLGPCFEVRIYILKHGGLAPTIELWRKAVPVRNRISPVLTAMTSVTGAVTRFTHIWPYKSVEERGRLRAKAAEEGVWPPPGGPDHIAAQQVDIFFPAPFSPIR